jgi:acyl CoA:acetate/3-ketoacid CoA transferase alpha subunit
VTVAEVEEIVPLGGLEPDQIHVPSVYVDRLVLGKDYQKPIERRTTRPR